MPRLLKRETISRLDVSQKALKLAFTLLWTPQPISHGSGDTDYAIEIGLIGIAAELAISACLFQTLGESGIIRAGSKFFITAGEASHKFQDVLKKGRSSLAVLTSGVDNPQLHLNELKSACRGFSVLFTARAAAVHAGQGVSCDVAKHVGKSVADFLVMLAKGSKWKPYLKDTPIVPTLPKNRTLIAQELSALLSNSNDEQTKATALASIFLVLPELYVEAPEWLDALARVQVAPKKQDITFLMSRLQNSNVGDIVKVGKGQDAIGMHVTPNDGSSLPVYPSGFKKKFQTAVEMWGAYVGTANGTIDSGIFSLPPIESVYLYSATGIQKLGLPEQDIADGIPAHSLWPFIATSWRYSGTIGPCCFLIPFLKKGEIGQLFALLRNACQKSTKVEKRLKEKIELYEPIFNAIVENKELPIDTNVMVDLDRDVKDRQMAKRSLLPMLQQKLAHFQKSFSSDQLILIGGYTMLIDEIAESSAIGTVITKICDEKINMGSQRLPTLRLLLHAACEQQDLAAIVHIIIENSPKEVVTDARKAVRDIDFLCYGPRLKAS